MTKKNKGVFLLNTLNLLMNGILIFISMINFVLN